MIYCLNCGKGIPDDSKFCTFCGTPTAVVDPKQPNLATAPLHKPVDVSRTHTTRRTVNEFYKDPAFWGSLILIAGFFLPFLSNDSASLFDVVQKTAPTDKLVLLWLIFPVAGLFMLLHSLRLLPGILAIFFSFLAVIALIYWGYVMLKDRTGYFGTEDMATVIKTVGIGLWLTVLGTILLLFHKRHTKVEINNTRIIDRNL
jgi:hypothetical protein